LVGWLVGRSVGRSVYRWVGNVERRERLKVMQNFSPEKLKERDHSEDLGVEGKIILEWILGKECGKV